MSPSSSAWTAPKLFCACSRERTGAAVGCVTRKNGGSVASDAPSGGSLELELVHVLDRERVRGSQNDLRPLVRSRDDHVVPQLAGLERLADLAGDRAFR